MGTESEQQRHAHGGLWRQMVGGTGGRVLGLVQEDFNFISNV